MNYIKSSSYEEINDGMAFLCLDNFLDDLAFVEIVGNFFIIRWNNEDRIEIDSFDDFPTIFKVCEYYNLKLLRTFNSRNEYDVNIVC